MNWEDDDLQKVFAELRAEEPPEAALTAVRARVLERTRRKPWRPWVALAAAAAALVLVLKVVGPAEHDQPAREQAPAVAALTPPAQQATLPAAVAPITKPATPRKRPAVVKAAPANEFVRLFTDDPDVVILWAVDSKGEDE